MTRLVVAVVVLALTSGCVQPQKGQAGGPPDVVPAAKTIVRIEQGDQLEFGSRYGKVCTPLNSPATGSLAQGFAKLDRQENDTWHLWSMEWVAENPTLATLGFAVWPSGQRESDPILFIQGTSPMSWNITSKDLQKVPHKYDLEVMPPNCFDAGVVAVVGTNQVVDVHVTVHSLEPM